MYAKLLVATLGINESLFYIEKWVLAMRRDEEREKRDSMRILVK